MMPQPPGADYAPLRNSISSIRSLLFNFEVALQGPPQSPSESSRESPSLFSVLGDAAKLLKAHITKLSLLIINKPFSPKEVSFILNALSTSVLPALMAVLELCWPLAYTQTLHDHLRTSLKILWRDLAGFLAHAPENEAEAKQVNDQKTLPSTGLIWGHCDALVQVAEGGLVTFIDGKVKGYAELFEDAITELEEWDPDDDDDDDDETASESEGHSTGKKVIQTPTTSDEEAVGQGLAHMSLNPQYELKTKVMKRLRLVKLLYPAIRKRRISTFPVKDSRARSEITAKLIQKLDDLVQITHRFTDLADELAAALYDDSAEDLETKLQELSRVALRGAQLAKLDWCDSEDDFSAWLIKWEDRFKGLIGSVP